MLNYIFLRTGKCHSKIYFSDVLYVQAQKKLVQIITPSKLYVIFDTFKEVEQKLPPPVFCKVHRSYLISLDHTDKFDNEFAYIGKLRVPISERYRTILKQSISILNCQEKSFKLDTDVDKLLQNISL